MLWRAPWLGPRLGLIVLATWDALVVNLSYNFIFLTRLRSWEGWNLGVTVMEITWLSASYLAGRYSPQEETKEESLVRLILRTTIPALVIMVLFVGHSWSYQVVGAETRFRGFLIPLMILCIALSTAGERVCRSVVKKAKDWVIYAEGKELDILRLEMREAFRGSKESVLLSDSGEYDGTGEQAYASGMSLAVGRVGEKADLLTHDLVKARERGTLVVPLVSWCERELQRIPPELLNAEWIMMAEGFGLRPGTASWRVKRLGDILGASMIGLITLPIVITAMLLIYVEDSGPMFYSQTRTGLYGRPIRIWKLRSMGINAEADGVKWAQRKDPRVTRIGRLIRATRVDELPQLLNVIRGDLSLIGPRPERPEIEEDLEKIIPNYRVRHWIRPGLSGWAQVCYPYGASIADSRAKLSYDLYYIRNANFFLDILIMIKTAKLVLSGEGASPLERK